ncbi:NACHT, LRR and PYD domains-containing protein 1 homolog [Micropterus salmoides]|uniref:NACHT, LRR and PYD domains-containing protein 1 homolog n=1 Tax=Micropterus salmoides TaxID=27706 RepID=UPI0018EB5B60|nr:NACHT, LRR and PYD domains-containing protein 1 homolog [Micropterus salmoides]
MNRIVHRKVLEGLVLKQNKETMQDNWNNEKIFKDPEVQKRLLKVDGEVRNYRVYATVGGTAIKVDANLQNSLWKSPQVSFYLGFTIRGPVAFDIQTQTEEKVKALELRGGSISNSEQIKPELSAWTDITGGPLGILRLGSCGGVADSSDWTKLEPKIKKVDEVQIYSLQSKAGQYECSVSALRWVCKDKASFKYQFCSWDEQREKPSCMDYMPAGPLLDIKVTAGNFEELHLPHWIDHDTTTSDMFAVLHMDTCGDIVEQVSDVTSSHVKLHQTTFSPRGVMMKLGFPVKVYCDVLIYKTKKEFLTLHVYLVPPDQYIQQKVERKETSYGSIIIPKPSPEKSLQMLDNFFLTTDTDTATIHPETLKLTCERRNPISLSEQRRNSKEDTVWACTVRRGDYKTQSTDHEDGQHFVDRHRTALINRVSDIGAVLDKLIERGLISNENYDAVRAKETTQDQMRDILKFLTTAKAKDALYKILKGMRSLRALILELEESESGCSFGQ